jgi:uncharacterized protein DUF4349/putative zinc finger protein
MTATEHPHSPTPEEVMAWLDGEGTAESRAAIQAHLTTCQGCQAMVSDMRGVGDQLAAWVLDEAPQSFHPPVPPERRPFWSIVVHSRPLRFAALSFAAVAVLFIVSVKPLTRPRVRAFISSEPARLTFLDQKGPGGSKGDTLKREGRVTVDEAGPRATTAPAARPQAAVVPAVPHQPMVIRTATLRIVVKDVNGVRTQTERAVADAGGFLDQLTVTGEAGTPQTLRGVLRVPSEQLSQVVARLRQLGQILEDTQQSEDVTDQVVDLDLRLANARATEQRLVQILKERTGKLSDVLEVEREIDRVRLDIERMDAERTNLGRRVTYATLNIEMTEERKAGLNAPLSFTTRLHSAATEGVDTAVETLVGGLLLVVSTGPTILVWALSAALLWVALRRFVPLRRRARAA